MEGASDYKNRQKKRSRLGSGLRILLVIVFILSVVVLILNSSVFSIKSITVEGNNRMSDEEVLNEFGLEKGVNLFRYFLKNFRHKFSPDPKLSSVDVYIKWPDSVRIVVVESVTIGYIYYQGTYLCLNQSGCVVDSTNYLQENIPVIKGITVGSFSIGDVPITEESSLFKKIVSIGTVLSKYGLSSQVVQINVRETENIVLLTERMEIRVGDASDIDVKVAVAKKVLEDNKIASGILHVEDVSGQIYIENKIN